MESTATTAENGNSDTETDSIEDEIEPKFKYQRIENDLIEIINREVVTCYAVHPKFLIFGTFLGRVYLLDHQGNSVASHLQDRTNRFAHTVAVNQIDVDAKAEYVATCSDDGKINITGLLSDEHNQNIKLTKAIKAVALDPDPKCIAGKRFIVGDDKLTLYEKNFLKKLKSSVLCSAEGQVLSVCWNGPFVAWASYLGVRVYDINERCSLGLMKWEEPPNARLQNFRCNFRWSNAHTLLIGWVDTIRICVIRKRNSIEASSRDLPGFIVDPVSTFQTSFYVCGLAPLTLNQLVVLGYHKEKDAQRKSLRPVLCVIDYNLNSSEEFFKDSISLRGFEDYTVNDYNLGCIIEENRYFIIAPKDVVVASLFNTDDRVKWLTEHRKFEEAMEVISIHGGSVPFLKVASEYIDDLLTQSQFDAAARLCLRVLGTNMPLWEEKALKFFRCKQLRALSIYLPTSPECTLKPYVYEMALFECLQYDASAFLNLIREWPADLYECRAVINVIDKNINRQHANELLEARAILHLHLGDYVSALKMFLELKNKDVFQLIRRYQLYAQIHDMIVPLIRLDRERAFQILLENRQMITPETVIDRLTGHEELLYFYLDALDKVGGTKGQEHLGTHLVTLCAKFEPQKLLPFLRRSNHYSIQQALNICKAQLFYPETVYLLGRMGNNVDALNIIIEKLQDIEMAIEFCKEHKDTELWTLLSDLSVEKPEILIKLLNSIVGYVDVELLVKKIKRGQQIPGLRKALVKMLWDFRLQVKIQEGSNEIQLAEFVVAQEQLALRQQIGRCITYEHSCAKCCRTIISKTYIPRNDLIAFNCGHIYHEPCVPGRFEREYCGICAPATRAE